MVTGQLPRAATLRIIRASLLMGVLLFGAISYYINSQRGGAQGTESADVLRIINIVLLVGAVVGILFLQRRHAAERDPARRSTLNIIAWAMGEAVALFGGVHFLLIGNPIPYLVGVMAMLASFAVVPIRD